MKRFRAWRDRRAALRARTMNTAQLTRGYWANHDRFFSIRVFMVCTVAGVALFYASARANDTGLTQTNRRQDAQQAKTNRAVADIVRARKEARLNTCRQDYAAALRARASAHQAAVGLITIARAAATPDKPVNEAAANAYVADQDQRAAATNPLRDCSPHGIDDFYTNAPVVPPCPYGSDGKGHCAPAATAP